MVSSSAGSGESDFVGLDGDKSGLDGVGNYA